MFARDEPRDGICAVSYPDYQYLRDHDRAFTGLLGSIRDRSNLGRGRGSRTAVGRESSAAIISRCSASAPQRGRTLLPSDEIAPGRHPVVVISDGLWRRDFAADPEIVGKTIEINNYPLTVVGVADPTFHGTTVVYDVEVYMPVMMAPQLGFTFGSQQTTPSAILSDRRATVFFPQGYLRPGTTLATPRRRPTRSGPRCRASGRSPMPRSSCGSCRSGKRRAALRSILLPTLMRPDRDGSAGAADRVRQHRRARARARDLAPRRNRRASGARRDADADRSSADRREPGPRPARRGARRPARAARDSRCSSGTPSRSRRLDASSSTSASTAWSSVSPCWSPAGARSRSDSSRRCRARASIWSR